MWVLQLPYWERLGPDILRRPGWVSQNPEGANLAPPHPPVSLSKGLLRPPPTSTVTSTNLRHYPHSTAVPLPHLGMPFALTPLHPCTVGAASAGCSIRHHRFDGHLVGGSQCRPIRASSSPPPPPPPPPLSKQQAICGGGFAAIFMTMYCEWVSVGLSVGTYRWTFHRSMAKQQVTLGVGSVNFRTVDFGPAFFNWSYCVLSDAWVLRCMMFIFCVKETDLGLLVFVAYSGPWCSGYDTMSFCMYHV